MRTCLRLRQVLRSLVPYRINSIDFNVGSNRVDILGQLKTMELANPDAPDYADRLLGQINTAAQDLASADRRGISGYTEQGGAYLRSLRRLMLSF